MIEQIICGGCNGTGTLRDAEDNEEQCNRCDGTGLIERPIGNEKLTREELFND